MRKFFTAGNSPLDDLTDDAVLALGGRLLDGQGSVGFGRETVIITVPNRHPEATALKKAIAKKFLTFETTCSTFVFIRDASIAKGKLQALVKKGLSCGGIDVEFSGDASAPSQSGRFVLPDNVGDFSSSVFDFVEVVEAITGAVVEEMFGHQILGGFEFTLDRVAKRKKDKVVEVSPPVWIDKVLRDADSGEVFVNVNALVRAGNVFELLTAVVANGTMQDARDLSKWLRSVIPCVVDPKGLSEFVNEVLRQAFRRIRQQTWVRHEGWLKDSSGVVQGFACGSELILPPKGDGSRYFVDIEKPSFSVKGTLEGWNQAVLKPASESCILSGMLQVGLAAMMVDLVPSISSGIFNLYGLAGNGKTLTLALLASLFGNTAAPGQSQAERHGRALIETFGSTALALQAQAQRSRLGLLLIDEVGSNNFKEMDKFIYTSANGSARTRANSKGGVEESKSKTLFLITTGEVSLMSLVSRNAKEGIFDRAVDISVGEVPFLEQGDERVRLMQSYEQRSELIAGVMTQYGTPAPAFAQALLAELDGNEWHRELEEFKQRLAAELPEYAARGGASRVLTRFALACVAGKVALRNGVFDDSIVDEEFLFNSVLVCAHLWVRTRWGHLAVLGEAVSNNGRIPVSSPKHERDIYRHGDMADGLPTIMVSKEWLEELFPGSGEVERIGKRFREDGQIFRHEEGRHTVGKFPYYHLRTNWLKDYDFVWCEESEAFLRVE